MKKQAKARRGRLEDAKALFQLWEDHEEEEAWLVEKKRICQTGIVAKDLRALISLQQKHKVRPSTICVFLFSFFFFYYFLLCETRSIIFLWCKTPRYLISPFGSSFHHFFFSLFQPKPNK